MNSLQFFTSTKLIEVINFGKSKAFEPDEMLKPFVDLEVVFLSMVFEWIPYWKTGLHVILLAETLEALFSSYL